MNFKGPFEEEFQRVVQKVYDPIGLISSTPVSEPESAEYGACSFHLGGATVQFRVAKITPTKIGQFVTLWKRSEQGPIAPYDSSDGIDYVVVCARDGERFGQFIFPNAVLAAKDVFSTAGDGGKRAIRVYPPWDTTVAAQAIRTQNWQIKYFLDLSRNDIDEKRARQLYGI